MIGTFVTRLKISPSAEGTFIVIIISLATVLQSARSVSSIENSTKCGGEYSGYQYTIGSPNYPENYPTNRDCDYILHGSRLAKCDQVFHLQFLDFTLLSSKNCNDDYLEIGDRLYCDKIVGIRRFVSKNNSLTVRFHSGTRQGGKGFKILVTTSPCVESKIGSTSSTERSVRHTVITKNVISEEIGNPESSDLLQGQSSYPVYRPEPDLTVEDLLSPTEEPHNKNPTRPDHIGSNAEGVHSPGSSFELPVRQSQQFRVPTNVSIVTPTSVNLHTTGPKISSYLFVPSDQKIDSLTKVVVRNGVDHFISPPPTELLLPSKWTGVFRQSGTSNDVTKFSPIEDARSVNHKFTASSYGAPNYLPAKVSDSELKTGEVLEIPNRDCSGKDHLEPNLDVTANFRASNLLNTGSSSAGGYRANYFPATTYGAPGWSSNVPNVNVGFTPNPIYGSPSGNQPGRPNDWSSGSDFGPFPTNVGSRYPNYVPSSGIGISYPGTGFGYSQCCRTEYTAQRFLLASPGFPSLFYSGNAYECVYSIRPSSPNICHIRFNLRFFNHGTEDSFCTNGYIEIDGQRICGCKRGTSIVSPVASSFPKTIGVRYTGYPRTKFNGFLIEVIQEPCSNNYPYRLSVEKKSAISQSPHQRTKRNLGYTYPKPSFGLNDEPVLSHPWGINTDSHQVSAQNGIGGNIFDPISTCQALSFFDWIGAAKDAYLRGARCIRNDNNGIPEYPGGSGIINPGYPGSGGPGTINPGYPGIGGSGIINPAYPGSGGSGIINPAYPGIGGSGTISPGFPGIGGSGVINPGYPGIGGSGTINPGYPGTGTISPGYPGSGGSGIINPGYPGIEGSGTTNPGYPGSGGPGTINPGYPGTGTVIPGYPGSGGSGTINPGYPGSGSSGTINPGFPGSRCDDVNVIEGIISSPQYPTNYPNNARKCFRFYKAPESCQLEVVFLDFDLENSAGCSKDYVTISGQNRRYCGKSLAGTKSLIDISRINIVEMYFVSDGYGAGRGFSAGFSQIPCRGSINR